MAKTLHAFAALVLLAGCATATATGTAPSGAAEPINPFVLQIEIGRYGVMMGHVEELTGEMPSPDIETDSPRHLARAQRETVWEYNLLRSQLCARALYREITCAPAFEPDWLRDRPDVEPPLELLQERSGVVGTRVMQLWDHVCNDARRRAGKPDDRVEICGIE